MYEDRIDKAKIDDKLKHEVINIHSLYLGNSEFEKWWGEFYWHGWLLYSNEMRKKWPPEKNYRFIDDRAAQIQCFWRFWQNGQLWLPLGSASAGKRQCLSIAFWHLARHLQFCMHTESTVRVSLIRKHQCFKSGISINFWVRAQFSRKRQCKQPAVTWRFKRSRQYQCLYYSLFSDNSAKSHLSTE